MGSPLCLDGDVFSISHVGVLRCLAAETGKYKWSRRVGSRYLGSPVAGDGKLYMVDQEGNFFVIAAANGKLLSGLALEETCAATPAIANGRIFVRTAQYLWCFGHDEP